MYIQFCEKSIYPVPDFFFFLNHQTTQVNTEMQFLNDNFIYQWKKKLSWKL